LNKNAETPTKAIPNKGFSGKLKVNASNESRNFGRNGSTLKSLTGHSQTVVRHARKTDCKVINKFEMD